MRSGAFSRSPVNVSPMWTISGRPVSSAASFARATRTSPCSRITGPTSRNLMPLMVSGNSAAALIVPSRSISSGWYISGWARGSPRIPTRPMFRKQVSLVFVRPSRYSGKMPKFHAPTVPASRMVVTPDSTPAISGGEACQFTPGVCEPNMKCVWTSMSPGTTYWSSRSCMTRVALPSASSWPPTLTILPPVTPMSPTRSIPRPGSKIRPPLRMRS